MEFPNCNAKLSIKATFPQEQTTIFTIRYEGDWISASTIAGTIKNADEMLRALAEDCGFRAVCFLSSFEMRDHEVEIGLTAMAFTGEAPNEVVQARRTSDSETATASKPSPATEG